MTVESETNEAHQKTPSLVVRLVDTFLPDDFLSRNLSAWPTRLSQLLLQKMSKQSPSSGIELRGELEIEIHFLLPFPPL